MGSFNARDKFLKEVSREGLLLLATNPLPNYCPPKGFQSIDSSENSFFAKDKGNGLMINSVKPVVDPRNVYIVFSFLPEVTPDVTHILKTQQDRIQTFIQEVISKNPYANITLVGHGPAGELAELIAIKLKLNCVSFDSSLTTTKGLPKAQEYLLDRYIINRDPNDYDKFGNMFVLKPETSEFRNNLAARFNSTNKKLKELNLLPRSCEIQYEKDKAFSCFKFRGEPHEVILLCKGEKPANKKRKHSEAENTATFGMFTHNKKQRIVVKSTSWKKPI